jgi:hypothetical protein
VEGRVADPQISLRKGKENTRRATKEGKKEVYFKRAASSSRNSD